MSNFSNRLATRIAAATTALAVVLLAGMGIGAWFVAETVLRRQTQYLLTEAAQAKAALASQILAGAAGQVAGHAVLHFDQIDEAGLSAELSLAAGLPVSVRRLSLGEAAPVDGVTGGKDGFIQGTSFSADGSGNALMWRLGLAELARRLASESGPSGHLFVWTPGSSSELNFGGKPLESGELTGVADIQLPTGIRGGGVTVKVVGDSSMWADQLKRLEIWLWCMGAVGVVLASAAALVVGRRLTRALTVLADAAGSYSVGAGETASAAIDGDDELASLAKSLAEMTTRLERAYRDLDLRSQTLLSNTERVAQVGSAVWAPLQDTQIWSEQFHAVLGLSVGDVKPSRAVFFARVHPADREGLAQAAAQAMKPDSGRVLRDFRIIRADGCERMVQFRAQMVFNGEGRVERMDATMQDITDRKAMENQLDDLVRELKRSNEELEQFAYAASHDLRQPLRTVRSYVSLIEDALDDKLDGETREYMNFIVDGVKRMDALIIDLLAYSRIGRGVVDGPVDCGRMVDLALMDLQAQIDESGAVIKVETPLPVVEGDSGEITRLFQNLIGNAVKYRHAGICPDIRIGCVDENTMWCFYVADNGIGIAVDHRERAFGIFQRLHGRHEYEGTGIGLALCRKMVERCGGAVWVDDNPGGGSVFRFTWPKLKRALTS